MTSGEVLFILAFIVLPTAVLVSSVWAVIFVRRQPDRVARSQAETTYAEQPETASGDEDTRLIATVQAASPSEETAVVPADTGTAYSPPEDAVDGGSAEPVDERRGADEQGDSDLPVGPEIPAATHAEDTPTEPDLLESQVPQSTDELGDIAERIAATEVPELEPKPTDEETSPPEEVVAYVDTPDEISETTELPVVDTAPLADEQPDSADDDGRESPQSEPGTRWRRRRSVKLRPSEAEGHRVRGRHRDPQRQVPQLGRSSRRSDTNDPDTPVDTGSDQDESQPETR